MSSATDQGRLDLCGVREIPAGLECYELDASGGAFSALPPLKVESRLILDNCQKLTSLPVGLTAGAISLRGCAALEELPEDLSTWFLDLTGCTQFRRWPQRARVQGGSLVLRDCTALAGLPPWLGRLAHLDLAGCAMLCEIPDGVEVTGWVDVGGTQIRELPPSLRGAALRWRGVRIDERVAFRPSELTAREALAQSNTEVRRVMIERMGYLRFAEEAGATVLHEDFDPGGRRQLLRIELDEDEPLVGLSCRCPSTGRQYLLRVPPLTQSCHQAAAWIAGFDDPTLYKPRMET